MLIELTAADGHRLQAYAVGPKDAKRGVVVVQEIFGVNKHMRRIADDFAKRGYAVVAPALFDRVERGVELGYEAADVARGRELRGMINEHKTLLDVLAAAAALPAGIKRGIIGYCWGGSVTWHGATRSSAFDAASSWYGGGVAAAKDEVPRCPVEMHFGETDASIPMSDVDAIRKAQPSLPIYVYEAAGHGFGCEDRGSFKSDAAALAESRAYAFFDKHLG